MEQSVSGWRAFSAVKHWCVCHAAMYICSHALACVPCCHVHLQLSIGVCAMLPCTSAVKHWRVCHAAMYICSQALACVPCCHVH